MNNETRDTMLKKYKRLLKDLENHKTDDCQEAFALGRIQGYEFALSDVDLGYFKYNAETKSADFILKEEGEPNEEE